MATRDRGRQDATSQHDRGYKRLFSHPLSVEELLRGFLPAGWTERLDFSTLERVGNSFVSAGLRERHGDVIWRLRSQSEDEDWFYLYLLLEFQSSSDPFMAVRLLTYVSLLLEEIIRREKLKPGDRLPAVLPVVLHNGKRPWRAPLDLGSLFVEVPAGLRQYLPRLAIYSSTRAAWICAVPTSLATRSPPCSRSRPRGLPRTFPVLPASSPRSSPTRRTPNFAASSTTGSSRWSDGHSLALISETMDLMEAPMLEETAQEWRKQALKEGMKELLLQQMTMRFGRLSPGVRRRVEEISSKQLRRLARKVLVATSLQQLGL
jgi:hypothetical protein